MALCKSGPLGSASGRIGSLVFAQSNNRTVIKAPGFAHPRNSPAQLAHRTRLAFYAKYWASSAMDSSRPAWDAYALTQQTKDRFGTTRFLSGFQWYMNAIPLMEYWGVPLNYPPSWTQWNFPQAISATLGSDGSFEVTFTGVWDPGYCWERVRISRWAGKTLTARRPSWTCLPTYLKSNDTTDLAAAIAALSLTPAPGERWIVAAQWMYQGQHPSPEFRTLVSAS